MNLLRTTNELLTTSWNTKQSDSPDSWVVTHAVLSKYVPWQLQMFSLAFITLVVRAMRIVQI